MAAFGENARTQRLLLERGVHHPGLAVLMIAVVAQNRLPSRDLDLRACARVTEWSVWLMSCYGAAASEKVAADRVFADFLRRRRFGFFFGAMLADLLTCETCQAKKP